MIKPDIQVVIVGNRQDERCEAGCGVDWASAEAIALARQRIKDRFGDRVHLDYIDLAGPIGDGALELNQKIGGLAVPVLVINGEPRISGQFDIRLLLDAIEAEIELKQ